MENFSMEKFSVGRKSVSLAAAHIAILTRARMGREGGGVQHISRLS